MGEIVLAAKMTHVPTMLMSEQPGPVEGKRQPAIDGHAEIARRAKALGADTVVICDTHWMINAGFHINANARFEGLFTSNEFPQFIQNLPYDYAGNPELGDAIAKVACEMGAHTLSHHLDSLHLEYGTLVPMRFMAREHEMKVVSVAAWCTVHDHQESRLVGAAIRKAVEQSDSKVLLVASGQRCRTRSGRTRITPPTTAPSPSVPSSTGRWTCTCWRCGRTAITPPSSRCCPNTRNTAAAEGAMHDTAMLYGALGWDDYTAKCEVVTPYFPSSGTGQTNVIFPVQ